MTVRYTHEHLQDAYRAWTRTQGIVEDIDWLSEADARVAMQVRQAAWDEYCDVRDWLKLGTTRARRVLAHSRGNVVNLRPDTEN